MVAAMLTFNRCCVCVNFDGKAFRHAVAAWLGQPTDSSAGDALFFDPYHGEYRFEKS